METERLRLRRFMPEDGQDLFEYLSDKEVVKHEPYDTYSLKEAVEEAGRRAADDAFWAVCRKEDNKMIGNLYFGRQEPQEFGLWEIGYVFNRQFQGNGYASEAAGRMLRYGFEKLGAERIVAHCNSENTASWHLLEKIGMRREGHFIKSVYFKFDKEGRPVWHNVYAYGMLAEEWQEREEREPGRQV